MRAASKSYLIMKMSIFATRARERFNIESTKGLKLVASGIGSISCQDGGEYLRNKHNLLYSTRTAGLTR